MCTVENYTREITIVLFTIAIVSHIAAAEVRAGWQSL